MRIFALTKKGVNKIANEDRILIADEIFDDGYAEKSIQTAIVAIADGVGGNNAGNEASNFVLSEIVKYSVVEKDGLLQINDKLISVSKKTSNLSCMATTLSGLQISNKKISFFHIGNTRIYVMQGAYLKQITEDNTTVNYLVKSGKISAQDASLYEKRNEITACFGGGDRTLAHALRFVDNSSELKSAKTIILTSDGIHEYVSADDFEEILVSSDSIKGKLNHIFALAERNGSCDDKSMVIIKKDGDK